MNGTNAGTNAATFTTSTLNNNDVVTVEMTSTSSCATGSPATSNPITMTVNSTSISTITASGATTFCQGNSVTLTASLASSYLWNTGATTQSITTSASGNYSIIVPNTNGCSGSSSSPFAALYSFDSVKTTSGLIDPTPVPTTTGITFGSFSSAGISANSNAAGRFSYTGWSTGATTTNDVYSSLTGAMNTSQYYEVTVSPSPGFVTTLSGMTFKVQRSGTGIRTYSVRSSVDGYSTNLPASISPANSNLSVQTGNIFFWNTDATTIGQNGSAINLGGANFTDISAPVTFRFYGWNAESTAGTFSIDTVLINGSATTSTSTTVTVHPLPVATITASGTTTFCQGDAVTLSAGAANSYLWSNGATTQNVTISTAGNYSCTETNTHGCSATSSPLIVVVNNVPATPTITPNGPVSFCIGGSVTLTSSAAIPYLWSNGATTQSITVSSSGNYSVTITGSNGCTATSSVTSVSVKSLPDMPTISGTTAICFHDSTILSVTNNCLGCGYNWSNGALGEYVFISASGTYSAIASNACGSSSPSNSLTVTVNPLPLTPAITANGTTLSSGSSSGCQWYFEGNIISGATSQTYEVTQDGDYSVMITDANGCSATSVPYHFVTTGIEVFNTDETILIIPNPNNGLFQLEITNLQLSAITIFNSIGAIIYQSEIVNRKSIIDLSKQPKGIYFIHSSGDKESITKKLVIH